VLSAYDPRAVLHQNGRRERRIFEQPQSGLDYRALACRVVGYAQRVAVTERHQESPRRAHSLGGHAQELDAHRRDALPLQLRSDQTHGLVADGSDGDEERDVHTIVGEQACRPRRMLLHQASGRRDGSHE